MREALIVTLGLFLLTLSPGEPARACTSFVMDTPDGPIFGANLDLFIPGDGTVFVNRRGVEKDALHKGTTGDSLRWVSQYGSITFNLAGNQFVWGGMNEAGLVMSSMELVAGEYPEPDERPAVLKGNWGQYVLDMCGTISEVLATDSFMRVQDGEPTDQYFVCDAQGNSAVIEYIDGEFVSYSGDDLPMKALANGPYSRAVAVRNGEGRWWWSNPGQSNERVSACHDRMSSFDASADTSAVNYAFGTLEYYVAAPHTKWNIVYDIPNRKIRYRTYQSPGYKNISMRDFDFSCGAPKLVLDVNTRHDGDVEGYFTPYDPDVNLKLFRVFCERYGVKISDRDSADLMEFFDGFRCSR
jgi:penicillin V acylase-like amidase (Ntn superfamily)